MLSRRIKRSPSKQWENRIPVTKIPEWSDRVNKHFLLDESEILLTHIEAPYIFCTSRHLLLRASAWPPSLRIGCWITSLFSLSFFSRSIHPIGSLIYIQVRGGGGLKKVIYIPWDILGIRSAFLTSSLLDGKWSGFLLYTLTRKRADGNHLFFFFFWNSSLHRHQKLDNAKVGGADPKGSRSRSSSRSRPMASRMEFISIASFFTFKFTLGRTRKKNKKIWYFIRKEVLLCYRLYHQSIRALLYTLEEDGLWASPRPLSWCYIRYRTTPSPRNSWVLNSKSIK